MFHGFLMNIGFGFTVGVGAFVSFFGPDGKNAVITERVEARKCYTISNHA